MQYDRYGNRIYGEFVDQFGQTIVIKKGAKDSIVDGAVQVRVGGGSELAMYLYPRREAVQDIVDALTAFLADTDGKGD